MGETVLPFGLSAVEGRPTLPTNSDGATRNLVPVPSQRPPKWFDERIQLPQKRVEGVCKTAAKPLVVFTPHLLTTLAGVRAQSQTPASHAKPAGYLHG